MNSEIRVWVTGAVGVGKSCVANQIEHALKSVGFDAIWADGDVERNARDIDRATETIIGRNVKVIINELTVLPSTQNHNDEP